MPGSPLLFMVLDFIGNSDAKYSLRFVYWTLGQSRLEESQFAFNGTPDVYHNDITLPVQQWSTVKLVISFATAPDDAGGDAGVGPWEMIYINNALADSEPLTPTPGFQAPARTLPDRRCVYGGRR